MLAKSVIEAEIVSLLVIYLRILIYSNECPSLHCNLAPHVSLWKTVVLVYTSGMMMQGTKQQNRAAECCCLASLPE